MKSYTFATLASAALIALRLQGADATEILTTVEYTGTPTKVNCLPAFNEARAAAGLVPFTEAATSFWSTDVSQTVCKAIMEEQPTAEDKKFNGTLALAIQDGDTGDCAAAVTHFDGALAKFGSLPPAFNQSEPGVYKNLQALSFVALYNPKDNPTLDCAYFSCTQTVKGRKQNGESATQELVATTGKKGLFCSSNPKALVDGEQPFSQEQFDAIKDAINSASTAVPALAALVAAVAGLSLF